MRNSKKSRRAKSPRFVRANITLEGSNNPVRGFAPLGASTPAAATQLNRQQLGEHVASLISNERNETHGDPHIQFECAQGLKTILRQFRAQTDHRSDLSSTELESIEMIATKLSRLTCGSNLQDAWLDIAGYALIAAEKAEKPL